jgi:hypothetical protein
MKLEAEGQRAIADPQSSQIESAVSLLSLPERSFLILSRSQSSYIQAAIVGSNRLVLEYRDGSAEKNFRSIRDDTRVWHCGGCGCEDRFKVLGPDGSEVALRDPKASGPHMSRRYRAPRAGGDS